MTSGNGRDVRLARRLRDLRESHWPDVNLTQSQLARALSAEENVAPATISSWESQTNPKAPPKVRLQAYARFFATRRSLDGRPHLLSVEELGDDERQLFQELKDELLALHPAQQDHEPVVESRRALLSFQDAGPIVIICPELPEEARGPLADEQNINHTRLHKYADLDALFEIFGHLRALNPDLPVLCRLSSNVQQSELQNHLVLLGGVGWNETTRRILAQTRKLPIEQFEADELQTGEVFRVKKGADHEERTYFPVMEEVNGRNELVEDLALLARLPNPFNSSRTLTICNGVHSSGVVGAVLMLTDETLRPSNERYLAQRFPTQEGFAILVKVPVVSRKALAPDLKNPDVRVFEWTSDAVTPAG
jgi:transcriptional regulator with XRE-family HTH domain